MEDSKILELLKKKSPQTTLEIAKSVDKSWHMVQEQLLEMQIDGKLDRINVGRQNLWFVKVQKMMRGTVANTLLIGIIAVIAVFVALNGISQIMWITEAAAKKPQILINDVTTGNSNTSFVSHDIGDRLDVKVLLDNKTANETLKIVLLDPEGNENEIKYADGGLVKEAGIATDDSFKPGIYSIKILSSDNQTLVESDFALGLVNINTRKSTYVPGETAEVTVGVLTRVGTRVNDSKVDVTIT